MPEQFRKIPTSLFPIRCKWRKVNPGCFQLSDIFFSLAFVLAILSPLSECYALPAAETAAQEYFSQALARIAENDTEAAGRLLGLALEHDPDHGPSLIQRGRLNLNQGEIEAARRDFSRALFSDSTGIKVQAYIGMGDVYRKTPNRNWQAVGEYRQALKHDPGNREVLYLIAQTGFALGETGGYRLASEMLVKLICLDPEYKDAYDLWRNEILDQTGDELRTVGSFLENYLESNRDKSIWWLDLAWDRFRLGETGRALQALDKLEKRAPWYKAPERWLLRARCLLEQGDTLGFETSYDEALKTAEEKGGFTRLFLEVQPVFTPREKEEWYGLRSPEESAALFREFWKRRDPDPISFHNERLVNHYLRLSRAEKYYRQLFPHSRFRTSREYFQLLSPGSSVMEYDPALFWNVNRQLPLDQRGMLFIRHGPPDRVTQPDITQESNPAEIWYYEDNYFTFEKIKGAGDFLFVPLNLQGAGDIRKAMETETFIDPLPALKQDYYGSEFQGPDGQLELEFYQSVPVSAAPEATELAATAAVFDSTWLLLAIDSTTSQKVFVGGDSLWIAVHRVLTKTGRGFYALRMEVPGCRAVSRKAMDIETYSGDSLDLSGVILGSPATEGVKAHSRRGIEIIPRPSLTFTPGEIISVYFEIYGLKANRDGERSFSERVTVSMVENKGNGLSGLFGILKWWGKKKGKRLTLSFQRQVPEQSGPVAEHFEIDTSELLPGNYGLQLEIADDNSSKAKKDVTWYFDLAQKEEKKVTD